MRLEQFEAVAAKQTFQRDQVGLQIVHEQKFDRFRSHHAGNPFVMRDSKAVISASVTTFALGHDLIAASGITAACAVFGSCTRASPPSAQMALRPCAPSPLAPVKIIPI